MPDMVILAHNTSGDIVEAVKLLRPQPGDIIIADPDVVDIDTLTKPMEGITTPIPIIFAFDCNLRTLPKDEARRILEEVINK